MGTPPNAKAIRDAYRNLYKAGLYACHYHVPAREHVKTTLRRAFRSSPASDFQAWRVDNTLRFLRRAGEFRGIEHKIVKNILHARYWQKHNEGEYWRAGGRYQLNFVSEETQAGFGILDRTIAMLNQTMGMCLR